MHMATEVGLGSPAKDAPPALPVDALSKDEFVRGVALICLGCFCAAIGLLLMKESTVHEAERPFFLRWRWCIGFCFLGVLTTVFDIYVLGILPLAIVAPFAGMTIVFTLLIASSGLLSTHERLSCTDAAGSALIILGVTLVSIFGPGAEQGGGGGSTAGEAGTDDELTAFSKPLFAIFAGSSLLTVVLWCLVLIVKPNAGRMHVGTALSAYSAAVCGALSQLFLKVVATALHRARGDFTSEHSPFRSPAPFAALTGLCFTAPLQLYLLDTALTGASVSYAVPCYQALLIGLTTVSGGIFFDEFGAMSHQMEFVAGVAFATCGLALLSAKPAEADARAQADARTVSASVPQTPETPDAPPPADAPVLHSDDPEDQKVFHRRQTLALRGMPRDALGLGMLNEKMRGSRRRERSLSFDSSLYRKFKDIARPPTWERRSSSPNIRAHLRMQRAAGGREAPPRRPPASRLAGNTAYIPAPIQITHSHAMV
mmetsp:Transcript_28605/g.92380  ORF Transcript_28605/g.92380 Transcript_28605/m.92380 type:complete len:485 (+) Transcript_28605:17-1471(+)